MQYSKSTLEVMSYLMKSIDPKALRNYATVLGIKNGMACVTDGFGLSAYPNDEFAGLDVSLNARYQESAVKFPSFTQILPQGKGTPVDGETVLQLAKGWKGKGAWLRLTQDTAILTTKLMDPYTHFNPSVIAQYVKHLPKSLQLTCAELFNDSEVLKLTFANGLIVVACAVRNNK